MAKSKVESIAHTLKEIETIEDENIVKIKKTKEEFENKLLQQIEKTDIRFKKFEKLDELIISMQEGILKNTNS
jgi:hypothetical protein